MPAFGDELRRLREKKQSSTRDVGQAVGIPHSRYSELEKGIRVPTDGQIQRLEQYYETEPGVLGTLMKKQWDDLLQTAAA